MTQEGGTRRKLIEVALPLKEINDASATEKSIRHGHPSTLHLWWARRPLAACRAVLFASIVDDPSSRPDLFPTVEDQDAERERLFDLIRRMVKWENANDERLLAEVRAEIQKATDGNPPAVADPFCGGGSIPLEAQRLGLTAYASDLNPVPVLITKALIEIPALFAGKSPVRPSTGSLSTPSSWVGATGLAEDVRHFGEWMRERAMERFSHLYPKARLPDGSSATVIAWLWARTITCPNPACGFTMPLMRSFELSKKRGRERHLKPVLDQMAKRVRFDISAGQPTGNGTVGRSGAQCLACGQPVALEHIRAESRAGRMGQQMTAIVAEGNNRREFVAAEDTDEKIAASAIPAWAPEGELFDWPGRINVYRYGMTTWASLFSPRQLTALTTYTDLISEVRREVEAAALAAGAPSNDVPLRENGQGAAAYAEAVVVYLSLALSKSAEYWTSLTRWVPQGEFIGNLFARHAIPMVWDFAEAAPAGKGGGSFSNMTEWIARVLERLDPRSGGTVSVADARSFRIRALVCTDPPYYDNIGYADLADFFYTWLRLALRDIYPDVTATVASPKSQELVASPYRHEGNRTIARDQFEKGLGDVFSAIQRSATLDYPITIFYAYKQSETTDESGRISTGWETMLEALLSAGLQILGTWPLRTEREGRVLGIGTNALASSVVLVCRPRSVDASVQSRQNFVRQLQARMPDTLRELRHAALQPVDLGQAVIGPGMAIFSAYSKVLEPNGDTMSVRSALSEINRALDETLAEFDTELDEPTRFLLAWYEQFGYSTGKFGVANALATQKATAVQALHDEGLIVSRGGSVRLRTRDELSSDWNPGTAKRLTAWEAAMHVVRRLEDPAGGIRAAGDLTRVLGGYADVARDLAYRLHQIATHAGRTDDALAFNALALEWPEIQAAAQAGPSGQGTLT